MTKEVNKTEHAQDVLWIFGVRFLLRFHVAGVFGHVGKPALAA